MKKVIFEQNEQVIRLEDITDDMIVGLLWKSGNKSFLFKDDNNNTIGFELNTRTTLNCWAAKNHKDYIKKSYNFKDVFVFDSPKELAQWLAE